MYWDKFQFFGQELGWEFRAEFRRIPENFRFRTLFWPNFFRFRFRFRSDYVFPPNFSLSEFFSRQFFSEFFHRKSPAAISAGVILKHSHRASSSPGSPRPKDIRRRCRLRRRPSGRWGGRGGSVDDDDDDDDGHRRRRGGTMDSLWSKPCDRDVSTPHRRSSWRRHVPRGGISSNGGRGAGGA